MKVKSHVIQGIVLSPIVYYFAGIKNTIIFLISFIFIDLDHYLLYISKCRNAAVKDMFKYFDDMWENRKDMYEICIFHTVEFFLLLFILGYWQKEFWVMLFGFFCHFVFDLYFLYKHNAIFTRAFSFIEYFIRKKKYSKVAILKDIE